MSRTIETTQIKKTRGRSLSHCESDEYPFEIRSLPKDEGGGYLITFPDLPGCMADGETPEEAIRNGLDAAESWLKTAKEFNDPIPQKTLAILPFHT